MKFDDIESEASEPERRVQAGARWVYFVAGFLTCLFLGIILQLVGVVLSLAAVFTSFAIPILGLGALVWFGYWLVLSRRVRHRRKLARRRERWMRRAAERDHRDPE